MISCNLFIWNVRELNSQAKRDSVRAVISLNRANLVCLQETKLSFVDLALAKDICGPNFTGFSFFPSDGASGGLLLA